MVPPKKDASPASSAARPWYRRRRYVVALVLLVLLVGLRIALPSIVRSQIEKQANAAITGQLTVGDVDLWLLSGAVALKDVALHAEGVAPDVPPLVAWKRIYVQVGYWGFFRHTVRIKDFALDEPSVHLERLASGAVPLPGLRRPPAPPEGATPTTTTTTSSTIPLAGGEKKPAGTPWNIVVDQAALHAGHFSVTDHVSDPPASRELTLENLGFKDFTLLRSGEGAPGHGAIEAEFGDGKVRIDTTVTTRAEGYAIEATVDIANLPLDRLQQHAPQLGWSTFTGRLDAHVTLRAEPNELPTSSGTLALTDLHVEVPGESEPALAWRKLAIEVEEIGIARRRAIVKSVLLDGGAVVVTPKGVAPLPLLKGRAAVETTAAEAAVAAKAASKAVVAATQAPAEAPPPSAPWTWKVGTVDIVDTRATIVLAAPPLVVEIAKGTITGLESAPGTRAAVDLQIKEQQGTLGLAGTVGIDPLAAQLTAKLGGLALGHLLEASGAPVGVQLPTGTLSGDLTIQADQGPLLVAGTVAIADLSVRLPKGQDFAVDWKQLELGIKQVRVPGVLPGTAPATPEPIRVDLDSLKLVTPVVTLTRTVDGLVLPGSSPPPSITTTPAEPAAQPAPPAKPAEEVPAPAAAPAAPVAISVGLLDLQGGQVSILDQTVKPFYRGKISAMTLKAHGLRIPENVFDDIAFSATLPGGAPLKVDAKQVKGVITLTAVGKGLGLQQFNPYVRQAAGYSISGGRLNVNSKVLYAPEKYDSTTKVEFDKLGVSGAEGDSLFLQKVGIPLTLALSLLTDLNGKISLGIPVSGDKSGTHVALGEIVAQALVKAILGAVTSPLKMLGAVGDLVAGGGGSILPEPIPCRPGLPAVEASAGERVQQLGGALGGAPALRISLHGMAGGPDVRALQEAAVLADLNAKQGVLGGLKNLANRSERNAIRDFLTARAAGGSAPELDPEYQKTLDEWAQAKTISDDQLRQLATARAEGVKTALVTGQGVDAARVAVGDPEVDREKGKPAVRIGFGS